MRDASGDLLSKSKDRNCDTVRDRIPKTRYVSLTQLELGVYDAVANFNIAKKASVLIYEKMNLIPGKFTMQCCDKIYRKRLFASKYKEMDSTKKTKKDMPW